MILLSSTYDAKRVQADAACLSKGLHSVDLLTQGEAPTAAISFMGDL